MRFSCHGGGGGDCEWKCDGGNSGEAQVGDQFVREVKIQMRKIEMRKVNERYQREVEQIFVGMRSSLA